MGTVGRRHVLGGAAALLAGCVGPGKLVAKTGEHRLTAGDRKTGLTLVLTTGVWNGSPTDLEDEWTVVHALVSNLGNEPVLLAPGDFELTDLRGFAYPLIDPGATFYRATEEQSPVGSYGRVFRRDYDPGGPVEFVPLDTPGDIGKLALPWGVLEPGTQIRGFLYFEPIVHSANGGTLLWRALTPEHRPLVDMRFELGVARG